MVSNAPQLERIFWKMLRRQMLSVLRQNGSGFLVIDDSLVEKSGKCM
jgi:hypothetical protein